ncbi:MAG TPA: hypothetical protein VK652_01090 [Steroidobacteraceae bacterium]|nr:hypothetical protein [Steroidobacteraceae bacterium]
MALPELYPIDDQEIGEGEAVPKAIRAACNVGGRHEVKKLLLKMSKRPLFETAIMILGRKDIKRYSGIGIALQQILRFECEELIKHGGSVRNIAFALEYLRPTPLPRGPWLDCCDQCKSSYFGEAHGAS